MFQLRVVQSDRFGICNEKNNGTACQQQWKPGDKIAYKNPRGAVICMVCATRLVNLRQAEWQDESLPSSAKLTTSEKDKTASPSKGGEVSSLEAARIFRELKELREANEKLKAENKKLKEEQEDIFARLDYLGEWAEKTGAAMEEVYPKVLKLVPNEQQP